MLIRCRCRTTGVVVAVAILGLTAVAGPPPGAAAAGLAAVTGVTTAAEDHDLQVIVHASAPVHFQVQPVRPTWIVIDVLNAKLGVRAGTVHGTEGVVNRVRLGQFTPTVVRVVVECASAVRFDVKAADDQNAVIVAIPNGAGRPAGVSPPPPAATAGPAPAAAPSTRNAAIVPGRGIGAVRLGMALTDVEAALGRAKETTARPGVGTDYMWYTAGSPGLGVRVSDAGTVRQIWVVNDAAYKTPQGLHAGSTESEVRSALGPPSWTIAIAAQDKSTTLMYDALGAWFTVRPSEAQPDRNVVFRIDVLEAQPAPQRSR
jgi:hypothetical protein